MALRLGLGLGLAGGAIDPAVAALRLQAASGGQPGTMASGPALVNSSSVWTPTLSGTNYYFNDTTRFRTLNGEWAIAGAGVPDNVYGRAKNISYDLSTSFAGQAVAMEWYFDGDEIELLTKGTGHARRLLIDGLVTSTAFPLYPNDGSYRWTKVSFGSSATRHLRLESSGGGYFSGCRVKAGQNIWAPSAYPGRLIVFGDSFTEGTGASYFYTGLGPLIAQELGYKDYWISGSGGTGWVNPGTGHTNGFDRWTADVVNRAPTMVISLLGLNDNGTGNDALIQSTLPTKLNELLTAHPNCLVHVCGIWDVSAPSGWGAGFESVNNAIIAGATGIPRVWTHNLKGISYTKADATHPDTAGHTTLYKAIYNKVAAVHGLRTVA